MLVPVARVSDPDRPADALQFGERHARSARRRNPDVVLHHMHDKLKDELMGVPYDLFPDQVAGSSRAYADFLNLVAP